MLGCPWQRAIPQHFVLTTDVQCSSHTHRHILPWLPAWPASTHTNPLQHQYLARISWGFSGDWLLLVAAAGPGCFSGEVLPPAEAPCPFWPPPSLGLSAFATAATVEPILPSVSAPCMTLSR